MMRKLVLMMGVSLDGLVARSGKFGAGGWGVPPEDPALKTRKLGWLREVGLHLMGRTTYEEMVQPVALGDGLPLFAGLTAPFVLDLVEARAYADGSVLHIYRPATG